MVVRIMTVQSRDAILAGVRVLTGGGRGLRQDMPVHHFKDINKDVIAEHGAVVVHDIVGVDKHQRPLDMQLLRLWNEQYFFTGDEVGMDTPCRHGESLKGQRWQEWSRWLGGLSRLARVAAL
jgi:hypothetical protein